MSIVDELQKLEALRGNGSLTAAEFAQAKAAILAGSNAPAAVQPQVGQMLSDQLAEVRYQNELARLDREWAMEREKYYITTRYGQRQLPSSGMGIGMGIFGAVFGLIWTIMAIAITGSAPDHGPFAIAMVVFPLFGVVFIVAAIGFGVYSYNRAQAYEKALAEFQSCRRAVRPEHFQ